MFCTILFYSIFCSISGCVLPLQEVALHQSPPTFSVICYPSTYRSLLPHNAISSMTFWSSGWSYTLCLPLCASNSPSVIFHTGDVSSPFPFGIVLCICICVCIGVYESVCVCYVCAHSYVCVCVLCMCALVCVCYVYVYSCVCVCVCVCVLCMCVCACSLYVCAFAWLDLCVCVC